jgi:hypothetical protein
MHDDDTFTALMPDGRRVTCRVKRDVEKLNDLDAGERLAAMLKMFPNPQKCGESFDEIFAKAAVRDDDGGDDGGGDSVGDHALGQLADVLVASGRFVDRGHALRFLTADKRGLALLGRLSKAAEIAKEIPPMDTTEHLRGIVKAHGLTSFCKLLVDDNDAHGVTEPELVTAITEHAAGLHPGLSPDAAFAKVFEADVTLRKAVAVAKAAPFTQAGAAPYMDLEPQVVGGEDARDVNDPSAAVEAIRQLTEIGRLKWPAASEAQQFANAFSDPANAKLANSAHKRPSAPLGGVYAFPR